MAGRIPDLTPTIIDSEAGEILFQGLEGPGVEMYRAEAHESMRKWHRRRRQERLALQNAPAAVPNEDPNLSYLSRQEA